MTKKTIFVFLILIFIILFGFQRCKSKSIIPENIYILKGYDYLKIKSGIKSGKFINDKIIEKELFSKIVEKGFSDAGFIFKMNEPEFLLEGELLKFEENENSDLIYTDVNGISIPIEDTSLSYEISINLIIKDIKTNKIIWSCKVSDERETDYPESFLMRIVDACIKTIIKKRKQ